MDRGGTGGKGRLLGVVPALSALPGTNAGPGRPRRHTRSPSPSEKPHAGTSARRRGEEAGSSSREAGAQERQAQAARRRGSPHHRVKPTSTRRSCAALRRWSGGGRGIRTPEGCEPLPAFEAGALGRTMRSLQQPIRGRACGGYGRDQSPANGDPPTHQPAGSWTARTPAIGSPRTPGIVLVTTRSPPGAVTRARRPPRIRRGTEARTRGEGRVGAARRASLGRRCPAGQPRRSRKNLRSTSPQASASTPRTTSTRWLRRGSRGMS